MDREILFRGKVNKIECWFVTHISVGDWVYGHFLEIPDAQIFDGTVYLHVDPATVGQFTGLTDKNGKKIFEGDKLYCEAQLDKAEMYVVFEEGQFRMVLCDKFKEYETGRGYYDINSFQKTVIGNIHNNPELLKEESE